MLKATLFSVTAAGTSRLGTISPTEDCQAGLFSAVPATDQEGKAEQQPGRHQLKPGGCREEDGYRQQKTLRRQHDAPAVVVIRKRAGTQREQHHRSVVEAWTRATMSGESAIAVIIQEAPTICTSPPKFDARLAIQTAGRSAGAAARRRSCAPAPVRTFRGELRPGDVGYRLGVRTSGMSQG